MTFAQFCAAHGLIIRAMRATGTVQRCPTLCAPSERKGWYIYDGGNYGTCGIWHGLENNAQTWSPGADFVPLTPADFAAIAAKLRRADADRQRTQAEAAKRAAALLATSEPRSHAYLARKGFPDMLAPCLNDGAMLLVTMWKAGRVVNLQRINEAGEKKFLHGGEVTGVTHTIGNQGAAVLCEGFATALSVAAAIKASKMRAHTVCCFSAGNLVKVAQRYKDARVIADNDKSLTGEKAAQKTGLRYWMPEKPGTDANDFHKEFGLFSASQRIRELLLTP